MQRRQQRCTPSKIISTGQIRQCNEDRCYTKIDELTIAVRMINGRRRMVAGRVDSGRLSSSESLHAYCHVLTVRTDHRQIEDGDLDAFWVAVHGFAVAVQDVDLVLQRCLVRR